MNRRRMCADCYGGHLVPCTDPACGCCGDYDEPDPYEALVYDEVAQLGEWPDLPEASGR